MKNNNNSGEHHKKMIEIHHRIIELEKLEIEIKRKKKSLHEIEEKIYELFDHDNEGISIVQNATIIYVNPSAAKLIGHSPEEVINTSFFNYVHPDEVSKIAEYYLGRLTNKDVPITHETKVKHRDGKSIDIGVSATMIKYKGRLAHFAIMKEISVDGKNK